MLDDRKLIARSIDLLALKPAKDQSKSARERLVKIEEQFKAKAKNLQGAFLAIRKRKLSRTIS